MWETFLVDKCKVKSPSLTRWYYRVLYFLRKQICCSCYDEKQRALFAVYQTARPGLFRFQGCYANEPGSKGKKPQAKMI